MNNSLNIFSRLNKSIERHGIQGFLKISKTRLRFAFERNEHFAVWSGLQKQAETASAVRAESPEPIRTPEPPVIELTMQQKMYASYYTAPKAKAPTLSAQTVLIFAGVPFDDIGGGQRCAQFARVLLAQGKKVIYIYAYQKYDFELQAFTSSDLEIENLTHQFIDETSFSDLLSRIDSNAIAIFEIPHIKFLPYSKLFKTRGIRTVFDLIDEWDSSLGGDWFTEEIFKFFVDNSDQVIGSAKVLVSRLKTMGRKDALYLPNAANEEIFDQYKDYPVPNDYKERLSRKKFLYFGSLYGEWFGWDYVKEAAVVNPTFDFYLIGDCPAEKREGLPPNIIFLGSKLIDELPAYLFHADAALMPFIPGKISDAVSPIKIFEYLFLKKPVIATNMPEILEYPNVFICKDPAEYAKVCRNFGTLQDSSKMDEFISENSWAARLEYIVPYSAGFKQSVSAVILIHNNKKIIGRMLNTLKTHALHFLKEIIVIDNNSQDGGAEFVEEHFPEVMLIRNPKNGCSSGRNLGIKHATGEYIAFFDSDQWFTSGSSFEEALSMLSQYPKIGAVGWGAGWFDPAFDNMGGPIVDYLPERGMIVNNEKLTYRTDIAYLATSGMFIPRSVVGHLAGFDEFYDPTCFEDTDLSFQIKELGFQLAYRNLSGIRHQPHQTTGASSGSDTYTKLFKRNSDYFKLKWKAQIPAFAFNCPDFN